MKKAPVTESDLTTRCWSVYLVRCADGSLYTGIAKDVAARVALHNRGMGAKYTRGRRPVLLVYRELVGSQGDALRREQAVKRMPRLQKTRLIAGFKEGTRDLSSTPNKGRPVAEQSQGEVE